MNTLTDLQAQRERLVLDHFADETRQDFDAVLGTFPHPHYELIPSGEVHDGITDVRQYYIDTRRAFPARPQQIMCQLVPQHRPQLGVVEHVRFPENWYTIHDAWTPAIVQSN